jgi:hypothetical protein
MVWVQLLKTDVTEVIKPIVINNTTSQAVLNKLIPPLSTTDGIQFN